MPATSSGNIVSRLFLTLLLVLTGISVQADGGDIFERIVRIDRNEGTRYQLLRQITDETGYLFVYDSQVVENDQQISIRKGEYTLRNAIYAITGNNRLELKVIGNHIAISLPVARKEPPQPQVEGIKVNYRVIHGTVFDLYSKETIPSATVSISNSNIGTVTNQNGVFRLSVPDSVGLHNIKISHVGYENKEFVPGEHLEEHIQLALEPKVIPLQEVVIRVIDPLKVLERTLEDRKLNYASDPVNMTAFYREGIEHKRKNVDLTEAVLQVYKTGFDRETLSDQVRLVKKRRIIDKQEADTLLTKVKAGIQSVLMLDMVKYLPDFLLLNEPNSYNYTHTDITVVDDRLVYVISFEQRKHEREPLFTGELYVDTENYALVGANFQINPKYVEQATSRFVEKRSKKIKLTLRKAAYSVSYRPSVDGKYYINHVRGDLEFRVRRKKHWFSSNLKVWFEMVNCKVDTDNVQSFPRTDRISPRTVFAETTHPYDAGFWDNFNVIVPEEELRELILNNLSEVSGKGD